MIIGLTGNFGTGKSTVSRLFKNFGFKVINVDKLYQEIYTKDSNLRSNILKEFGVISKTKLKKIVFSDASKLKRLNKITHPVIIKEMKKEIDRIKKQQLNQKQ